MKFMKELTEYWDGVGQQLTRIPSVGGKELDLHLLFLSVGRLGGYEKTTQSRRSMHDAALMYAAAADLQRHCAGSGCK